MSGVFGIADVTKASDLDRIISTMAKRQTHYSWHQNSQTVDERAGAALGRIGIGIFNPGTQPIHSEDRAVTLVFSGELTKTEPLRHALRATNGRYSRVIDEELILAAYAHWGVKCMEQLHGQFILAILDRNKNVLILANDRFGLYPTYYRADRRRLIFAPEMKALLSAIEEPLRLRMDALAEYFRFQRLLGSKTFFEGIHVLPPATILQYHLSSGELSLTRYWDLGQTKPLPATISFDEAVEEGERLFSQAIGVAAEGSSRIGVYLSGGLDSRGIAGTLAKLGRTPQTFTFGQPGCRDEHYARQIAGAIGAHHHFYPYLDGKWIEQYAPVHVQLTEGFHSWLHMHGINMLADVRQSIDINVSGLGDLLWPDSQFTPPHLISAPDDIAFSSIFFELYHQKYSWPGLTYPEEYVLYAEPYRQQLVGAAYDSFQTELRAYSHLPYAIRAAAFNLTNHFARHLVYHVVFGRSHVEYRLPYFDLELLTFAYRLPLEIGLERRVQKGIISRYLPRVARIPATSDELPVVEGVQSQRMAKLLKRMRHQVERYLAPVSTHRSSLYADYEGWLRTDLRTWAESILFDRKTLDRGIFARDALTSLWARHLTGNELWTVGKIASIITFEMMMRELNQ